MMAGDIRTPSILSPSYRLRRLREVVAGLRLRVTAGEHVDLEWMAELEAKLAGLRRLVRR
jgi:hypothetical protein